LWNPKRRESFLVKTPAATAAGRRWSATSVLAERGCLPLHRKEPVAGCGLCFWSDHRSISRSPGRLHCGKQIASYVGLVPSEESSGDRRRMGHISKQGNSLLRYLLVEAAQVTGRSQPEWRSHYFHLPCDVAGRSLR
jgi:hypothetical protein